jgi:hypothetical protein
MKDPNWASGHTTRGIPVDRDYEVKLAQCADRPETGQPCAIDITPHQCIMANVVYMNSVTDSLYRLLEDIRGEVSPLKKSPETDRDYSLRETLIEGSFLLEEIRKVQLHVIDEIRSSLFKR